MSDHAGRQLQRASVLYRDLTAACQPCRSVSFKLFSLQPDSDPCLFLYDSFRSLPTTGPRANATEMSIEATRSYSARPQLYLRTPDLF